MIKIKFNEGEFEEYEVSGNLVTITADLFSVIRNTYRNIQEADERMAKAFKNMFEEQIGTAFADVEEIEKKVEEAEKELGVDGKRMSELLEKLEEISKEISELVDKGE